MSDPGGGSMAVTFDPGRLATVHLVPLSPFSPDGLRSCRTSSGGSPASLYEAGVRVFLPAAGTGEFHSLTAAEVVACVGATRAAVGRRGGRPGAGRPGAGARPGDRPGGRRGRRRRPARHAAGPSLPLRRRGPRLLPRADEGAAAALPRLQEGAVPERRPARPSSGETGRLVGVKYAVNDLDAFTRFAAAHGGRLGAVLRDRRAVRPVLPPGRGAGVHLRGRRTSARA